MGKRLENKYCAGYDEGVKDSCQGDSGGPLMVREGAQTIVIGVVSYGHKCAKRDYPGVYQAIAPYLRWIEETIGSKVAHADN